MRRLLLAFFVACGGSVSSGDAGSTMDSSTGDGAAPHGSGITCGSTTCKAGSEACCVQSSKASCLSTVTGDCSGPVFRIQCDDTLDCPGQQCCFTNVLQSAEVATMCLASCSNTGMSTVQVCINGGDCPNGVPCNTFTCGGSFGSGKITLGLCAQTAPSFCQ